jgi:hypothetical protein
MLRLNKPPLEQTEIQYRENCNMESFNEDLKNSTLLLGNHQELSVIVEHYEKTLEETLDKHAPLKRRMITIRPSAPWYRQKIRKRQKLERHWRVSRLCIDRQMHVEQCQIVNKMPRDAKASYTILP